MCENEFMRLADIHPVMQRAYGVFEGLRRLGFDSKEIFFILGQKNIVFVMLETQGKRWAAGIGVFEPAESWISVSHSVVRAITQGEVSEEDLQTMWRESLPYKHPTDFMLSIRAKGITLPLREKTNWN